MVLNPHDKAVLNERALVDPGSYASAILNILDDFTDERQHRDDIQRAVVNILEDFAEERMRLGDTQRAVLNILDDFDIERKIAERANIELRDENIERTHAEAALRRANVATIAANRELEAFSYSVAHDLRAPLRSIDGFSQALLEDCAADLPETGMTYLGYIRESAQSMAQLIDGLLSLSRVGRVEVSHSLIDLSVIARTVFARLQRDQPDRLVELTLPATTKAVADARLLEIVLENLIGNAWKFTRKRAQAHIEFGQTTREGHRVWFVRDDGAGFDMAYAEKLFAVFQRLHTVSEFEGIGIGLANVERVVRRHGGRVWAEGKVDCGATFYFTLEEVT